VLENDITNRHAMHVDDEIKKTEPKHNINNDKAKKMILLRVIFSLLSVASVRNESVRSQNEQ
jgi:hypothetical protein